MRNRKHGSIMAKKLEILDIIPVSVPESRDTAEKICVKLTKSSHVFFRNTWKK